MKAKKLINGDYVGVCSPSGIVKQEKQKELLKSEKIFNQYQLNIIYAKNLYAHSLDYSASVEEKIEDINDFLLDNRVKAISFCRGGSNCNSLLDKLDYNLIKSNPKLFIGFSDNTALLNAIYNKTGLITYHFTNFKGFCESNIDFNKQQFEKFLLKGEFGEVDKNSDWKKVNGGIAKGTLIGGNLKTLVKIINTDYCPNFSGKILFLEELFLESPPEEVESDLYVLKQNKVFDKINGLILGAYEATVSFDQILLNVIKKPNFPIIKCNDFGHTKTNIIMPIGIDCTLDGNNANLIYNEEVTD